MAEQDAKRKTSIVDSTIYVVVTGVLVTVLGQFASNQIWPAEETTVEIHELVNQSPVSLSRWHEMTLQLNRAPTEVRERLFDDYRGERVVWVGYFDRANDHSSNDAAPNNAVSLIMYDSKESLNSEQLLGPPFVRCFFTSRQLSAISKLRRGQRIAVRGTLANPTLMGTVLATDLSKCELLAVDDADERLAVLPDVSLR